MGFLIFVYKVVKSILKFGNAFWSFGGFAKKNRILTLSPFWSSVVGHRAMALYWRVAHRHWSMTALAGGLEHCHSCERLETDCSIAWRSIHYWLSEILKFIDCAVR
jgi:hypothetical protein